MQCIIIIIYIFKEVHIVPKHKLRQNDESLLFHCSLLLAHIWTKEASEKNGEMSSTLQNVPS